MKLALVFLAASLTLACGGSTDSDATGSGGSTTGGTSSGGTSSGGTPGSGGSVGGSPGTGGVTGLGPECTTDAECTLFSDCCSCEAYGPNQAPPPSCLADCAKSACEMNGASDATV